MQYFDSEDKWNEFLNKFGNDTAQNKGVLFENLVEKILLKLFPERKLKFTPTKETHDGSKDFWAIDNNNKRWWAECKNYTQNLSMKVLSPTLFMAELYDIDYLLFFSYSPLNGNLLRKIGIYSRRHGKRTFIYDDVNLENLIIKYFPDAVKGIIKSKPISTIKNLYIKNFAEKHPKLYLAENFDGYYDISKDHELTVGEIYNIYCLVINRKSTTTNVTAKISGNDLEYYKLYGMVCLVVYRSAVQPEYTHNAPHTVFGVLFIKHLHTHIGIDVCLISSCIIAEKYGSFPRFKVIHSVRKQHGFAQNRACKTACKIIVLVKHILPVSVL